MDIYNLYATSILHEAQGKPFTKEFGGDATFLIARTNNPKYARIMQAEYEANKATLDDKSTEESRKAATDCNDRIMVGLMAQSILLGWAGNVTYQGKPLPYSVENAMLLLALPEFRRKVAGLADDYRNYRLVTEEEDVKNSALTSSGPSLGVNTFNSSGS